MGIGATITEVTAQRIIAVLAIVLAHVGEGFLSCSNPNLVLVSIMILIF